MVVLRAEQRNSAHHQRANLTLFSSEDEGETWAPRVQVWAGTAMYSTLALAPDVGGQQSVALAYERNLTAPLASSPCVGVCSIYFVAIGL